jgi:ParB family transcriptional regulator, chromosome partitioning protein
MARKITFDSPATESPAPQTEARELPPQRTRPLLGMERPIKQSSALGAISQSLAGISEKVKRAEEIEQKLIEGQVIVDLDPALIDNSFVPDRMRATVEQNAAFRELIRQHGQNVPILVRPRPGEAARYEVAFGHRRLRAARELGIKVRAVIRSLTDEQLVIAQGQENSGRTDLTFIERARFAARLADRKFSREIIMASLNVDKAALSRLICGPDRQGADLHLRCDRRRQDRSSEVRQAHPGRRGIVAQICGVTSSREDQATKAATPCKLTADSGPLRTVIATQSGQLFR